MLDPSLDRVIPHNASPEPSSAAAASGSSGSHHGKPSCALESLNEDALTAIMAASHTLSDLRSFIHASPILYHCFLAEKRSILLGLASRDLGPGLRDAAVLARMEPLDNYYDKDYYSKVADAVEEYRRRLAQDQPPTQGIDIATAIRIIQMNRTTQFFVDLYISTRLYVLRRAGPASTTPLSAHERFRLSVTFTRLQIIMHLRGRWGVPHTEMNEELLFNKFFSLFRPWEIEQISEAHCLVYITCHTMMKCDEADPLGSSHGRAVAHERLGTTITMPGGNRDMLKQRYFNKFYWNPEALRRKILEVSAESKSLLERIHATLCEEDNRRMSGAAVVPLASSHRYRRRPASALPTLEDLCGRRHPDGAGVPGNETADAPYGWRDALEGRDWQVWGLDFLQNPPPPLDRLHYDSEVTRSRMGRWRWTGFVFWDQWRVEALKQTATFSGYQTGWLVNLRASGN